MEQRASGHPGAGRRMWFPVVGGGSEVADSGRIGTALIIKFLFVTGLTLAVLPFVGRSSWDQALVLGLIVAGVSYLVGDRIVLPRAGSAWAVVADFVLDAATYLGLAAVMPAVVLGVGAAITMAGAVTLGEILFHQYLLQQGVGVR